MLDWNRRSVGARFRQGPPAVCNFKVHALPAQRPRSWLWVFSHGIFVPNS